MKPFRKMRSLVRRMANRLTAGRDIRRLESQDDLLIKMLATTLTQSLGGPRSPDEQGWVNKIEALRSRLLASEQQILVTDFGAGAPDQKRTAEQMEQGVAVTRTVQQCCRASKPPEWSFLLFQLIRTLRPHHCLELGACVGVSAAYQTAALTLNRQGHLISLEGSPSLAALAKANLRELGLDRCEFVVGRFQDTLPDVLRRCPQLDYAFIDGHHDELATRCYFEQIKPHLSDGAVVVFDDIEWSAGMERAWNAITEDPHVGASVHLGSMGLCVTTRSPAVERKCFQVGLPF